MTYPDWPRLMKRPTAARYCDMTSAAFEREVMTGRLPTPQMFEDGERWDRVSLDEALDRLFGRTGKRDWRKEQPGLAA